MVKLEKPLTSTIPVHKQQRNDTDRRAIPTDLKSVHSGDFDNITKRTNCDPQPHDTVSNHPLASSHSKQYQPISVQIKYTDRNSV
jgi:hypothetical protein